jgi:hypothetical protein
MRVKVRSDFTRRVTDGRLHQGITAGEDYFVIGLNNVELRVVDDNGEPVLYPKDLFEVVDPSLPAGWRFREYQDGEYHLDPVVTGSPGFYEDFFGSNGDRVAQSTAQRLFRTALEAALAGGNDQDQHLIRRDLGRLKGS